MTLVRWFVHRWDKIFFEVGKEREQLLLKGTQSPLSETFPFRNSVNELPTVLHGPLITPLSFCPVGFWYAGWCGTQKITFRCGILHMTMHTDGFPSLKFDLT